MTRYDPLPAGRYRLAVADYMMLAEAGAFGDARTELIDGEVFVMNSQFRPHAYAKTELYDQFRDALRAIKSPPRAMQEVSVHLSTHDMPLPDIVLTSAPRGPGAVEQPSVALVVEVAVNSVANDTGVKQRLYAARGVPEYWVADVNSRVIEQYWTPGADGYADHASTPFGDTPTARTIAGLAIPTDGL